MPYIHQDNRTKYDQAIDEIVAELPESSNMALAGDVNFVISSIIKRYLAAMPESYTTMNAMVGALECSKLELYRRTMVPYEDRKIHENGDI